MRSKPLAFSLPKTNLWVDVGLFSAILLALAPVLTGLAIHEWLSLALAVAVIVHLLLHWSWIVTTLARFFAKLPGGARLNLILNLAFFIDFTLITFTGLMISREALPWLGLTLPRSGLWSGLHRLTADLSVFIVGLHVALHWKWIVSAVRRYMVAPVGHLFRPRPLAAAIQAAEPVGPALEKESQP